MNPIISFPLFGPTAKQNSTAQFSVSEAEEVSTVESDNVRKQGVFGWTSEHQSIRDVIWNILLTAPGERLMRPEFGAGLTRYIHHPNNETTRRLIADIALKAIQRWEPRIEILELTVTSNLNSLNKISLNIFYRIRATGVQENVQLGLPLQG